MINASIAASPAARFPQRPGNDWIQNPQQPASTIPMPLVKVDKPDEGSIAQADIGYGMNYNARAVRNLRFGSQNIQPVFGDPFAQAARLSEGENGAFAIVKDGANMVLRSVLQPAVMHATDDGERWTPFRPADALQEWDPSYDMRVPRETNAVRLLDPSIQAIVDDGVIFDPRAPKLVASGGPATLDGKTVTVPLTPVG